jgi:predicted phage baseplate assembly protein
MPLEEFLPRLDTRTFEELVREARLRIPRYTPEWTDFNESDPGITLVQLFAWLTEMTLYQMNRVPERNYIKFLQLLGMELRPAQPAIAHLTFTAGAGAATESIRARSQIGAQPPEGGDLLVFETEAGLDLIRVPLSDVQVFDGTAFTVVTQANEAPDTPFRPLGWVPQVGSALYLGFAQTDPPAVGRPFPRELRFRVFLPAAAQAGLAQNCQEAEQPPAPPVTLVWEYKPTAEALHWRRLNVYEDKSIAFTREGYILLEGPAEIEPTGEQGKVADPRFWLRCRLAGGSYPTGRAPEIDFIRPNTVPAQNLSTVREEIVGTSEGHPDQTFELRYKPVQPGSLDLWIEAENEEPEQWEQVEDFLASGPEDSHYVLNATAGVIRFGDGQRGRIPVAGAEIIAREYRYGGGAAGNVGDGLINTPLTSLVGVEEVTNERPAVGGRDEQDVEELKEQAPHVLRSRNRAVTAEDFAALAEQAGGVAKATAIPLAHPDHPGVEVPGAVTVVIVPDSEDVPPQPSSDLIRYVCRYLNRFRLLTTEVYVKGPEYQAIKVEARVAAQPYAAFDAVARDVVKALNAYLDPLGRGVSNSNGLATGEKGWKFGQELYPTSLYSVILGVDGVAAVPSLALIVNGRPHDNPTKPVIVPADGLVYGADHEITVVPSEDL